MTIKTQTLQCLKCDHKFRHEGPSDCPKCGHVYCKWLDYKAAFVKKKKK